MTEFTILIFIATAFLLIHVVAVGRRSSYVTVDGLFVYSTWTIVAGSLALIDPMRPSDVRYAVVVLLPFAAYVTASVLLFEARRGRARTATRYGFERVTTYRPTALFWGFLALSVAVTVAYYTMVGYNLFLNSLTGSRYGTAEFSALRLDAYSGSRYLFPGYVNQFKNILLPGLSVVASTYLLRNKVRGAGIAILAMGALSCYGLLGTGQRGAFVLFALTLATYLFLLSSAGRGRRFLLLFLAAAPVFAAATLFQQRAAALSYESSGLTGRVAALIGQMLTRFFFDNQEAGRVAFEYIQTRPTSWGAEWAQQLLGILPGNSGSMLSTEVARYLWGSDRGTVPLTLWGSTFFNWGWVGLLVFPALLAVLYRTMTQTAFARPFPNTLELIGISGSFVSFGMWLAGGPESILNDGAVVYLVVWWVGRRISRSISPAVRERAGEHPELELVAPRVLSASHPVTWPSRAPAVRAASPRARGRHDRRDPQSGWNQETGGWPRSSSAPGHPPTRPRWPDGTHSRRNGVVAAHGRGSGPGRTSVGSRDGLDTYG